MALYTLEELIEFARRHSPFYRELYASVGKAPRIVDLPVVDQSSFWEANGMHDNRVLTGPIEDGIVFKSGGTTGQPKFSVFSQEEWDEFTRAFGRGLVSGGLAKGERIVNLFYGGNLYASFLFINKSVEFARQGVLLPMSGAADIRDVVKVIRDFGAEVVAGVPSTLVTLAEHLRQSGAALPSLKKVLYGGESFYDDQRRRFLESCPGVKIQSVGYASVDAGLLGYVDAACQGDEHRAFGVETVTEILDDFDMPIAEPGQPGRLVVTNLTRRLMPIIRYPAGDRAEWVEPLMARDRKFRILGRSEEAARVGPVSLYYDDVRTVLEKFAGDIGLSGFQMVIRHEGMKDQLILRVAVADPKRIGAFGDRIVKVFLESRPMLNDLLVQGLVHMPRVEFTRMAALEKNRRTGKLRRVIDERSHSS